MPQIFNQEEKEILREKLLTEGFEQLKRFGYKKTNIEEITKHVGIAKGTFYNFFTSKEQFFYELIIWSRDKNRYKMKQFFQEKKKVNKDTVTEYITGIYLQRDMPHMWLSDEDEIRIFRKLPQSLRESERNSIEYADEFLEQIRQKNPLMKKEVVVNMMNLIVSVDKDREMYCEAYWEDTIMLLAKALADYIFQK